MLYGRVKRKKIKNMEKIDKDNAFVLRNYKF